MARQIDRAPRRPGIGGTVAKIAIGVVFMAISGSDPGESNPTVFIIMCLTIGLALIAWGVLPWLRFQREEKRIAAEKEARRLEEARIRAEEKAERENAPKLCPACGATSRGTVCEYCGTKLL